MATAQARVLMTGLPVHDASRYEGTLTSLGFGVVVEHDPHEARERLDTERFEAVVAGYPLAPGALGVIVGSLRSRGSHNAGTGLVLVAPRANLRAAAGLVGRGVNKALSSEEDPTVLGIVVQRMVELVQPMAERLPLHFELTMNFGDKEIVAQTENLSGAGMLVEMLNPPSVGDHFTFSLAMPGETLEGEAKVVRHTTKGREPVNGFGARFLYLENEAQRRLVEFLRAERHNSGSTLILQAK